MWEWGRSLIVSGEWKCPISWLWWYLNDYMLSLYRTVHLREVNFMVYKFYFSKPHFFLVFLGPYPWHTKPRVGAESELQSCWPTPQPQQQGIQATSTTYITAHGNAGSLTHRVRPGIKPTSSWILVRFVSSKPWWELGSTLFDIGLSNVFLDLSSQARETEVEINRWDLNQLESFCIAKKSTSKKGTYWMEENICQWYIW